jgi:integrase
MAATRLRLTEKYMNSTACSPRVSVYRIWDEDIRQLHARIYPTGRKCWFVYYQHHGRPREYKLGDYPAIRPEAARKLAQKKLTAAAEGDVNLAQTDRDQASEAKRVAASTLGTYIESHYQAHVEESQRGHADVMRILNTDFKPWHNTPLVDINEILVKGWRRGLERKGIRPATVLRRYANLSALLNQAVRDGIITENPLKGVKILPAKIELPKVERYLTKDESNRLYSALEQRQDEQREARVRHREWQLRRNIEPSPALNGEFTDWLMPMVILALNTGMRRGELFQLEWSAVSLSTRTITVRATTAKSAKTRYIHLNDQAYATLTAWQKIHGKNELVFPNPATDKALTTVKKTWAALMTRASISNFRFHDMRHDFASQLVMGGVDLNTVRELMGHATLEMTLRYAHLAADHKAAAVAILGSR